MPCHAMPCRAMPSDAACNLTTTPPARSLRGRRDAAFSFASHLEKKRQARQTKEPPRERREGCLDAIVIAERAFIARHCWLWLGHEACLPTWGMSRRGVVIAPRFA